MTSITATERGKQLYGLLDSIADSHEPVQIAGKRHSAVPISEDDSAARPAGVRPPIGRIAALTAAGLAVWLGCLRAAPAAEPTAAQSLTIIKDRIRAAADRLNDIESNQVAAYSDGLRADGAWPDVDYADKTTGPWKTADHLTRIELMAKALLVKGQRFHDSADLRKKALAALDHWLEKDYGNSNWWWPQIGVPMYLGRAMILLEPDLSAKQLAAGIAIMKRSRISKTGANLTWLAANQVMWACLANDANAAASGFAAIWGEIRIADGRNEGIKPDRSFWQHRACLYSGGYGAEYLADCSRLAGLAGGTPLAFPQDKLDVLASCVLDGQQWMVRGQGYDYGVVGRRIAIPGGNDANGLVQVCRDLVAAGAPRKDELATLARRLEAGPSQTDSSLSGNRHFWNSDYMAHHRPGYFTSARMVSARVFNTDYPFNSEGLLSHRIADGANFLMRTGREYEGIFPVWDWHRVPGVTVEYAEQLLWGNPRYEGSQFFVGGVSDGTYGCAAMDFARIQLTARKAWFFFDDQYVCLGSMIACPTDNPVYTSVNQCLLNGPVLIGGKPADKGTHEPGTPAWVHHDGVGYVFPKQAAKLVVGNETQTGSWFLIRRTSPRTRVARDVLSLWFDHGVKPDDARSTYAYTVLPDATTEQVQAYAAKPAVALLSNTASVQAVYHAGLGLAMAVFYKPEPLTVVPGLTIEPDGPCLVLLREQAGKVRLAVSRPDQKGAALTVIVSRGLRGAGCKPVGDGTAITFDLPTGGDAGKSVIRDFP